MGTLPSSCKLSKKTYSFLRSTFLRGITADRDQSMLYRFLFCLEGLSGLFFSAVAGTRGKGKVEPPTYFPLHPCQPAYSDVELASPSVSVSVSSPSRLKEAGLADLLKRQTVARPPSWEGKWTFLGTWWKGGGEDDVVELGDVVEEEEEETNRGVLGAELAL